MASDNAQFVAIMPARVPCYPLAHPGPLQLVAEPGGEEQFTTDTLSRERYVKDPFARRLLWGAARDQRRFYFQRDVTTDVATQRGSRMSISLHSFEILRLAIDDGARGLIAVHGAVLSSDSPLIEALVELADIDYRHGMAVRTAYQDYIGVDYPIAPEERRARMLFLVDHRGQVNDALDPNSSMPVVDQWLYYLTTCQMPSRFSIPIGAHASLENARVPTPGSWVTAAMGDAVAQLRISSDDSRVDSTVDFQRREVRFHTIDTDLVLLTEAQAISCTAIETEVAEILMRSDVLPEFRDTRRMLNLFRGTYWGDKILDRGPGVQLLYRLHANHDLQRRVESLRAQVLALESDLQATLSARTNAVVGAIAVIGLPLSIALTAWSVLGPPDAWAGVRTCGIALGISVLMLGLPGLRGMIRDAFPRKRTRR